ncbi:unnamed protein product [Mycena citricolor]|uniref:P/Homo B domain-containing protein n=1 Tax=Mycena citricolor TaxID=2018698 RepID=A0AAD2JW83_9AGAR|nr:unnamed protein product [Mycena citricolor]
MRSLKTLLSLSLLILQLPFSISVHTNSRRNYDSHAYYVVEVDPGHASLGDVARVLGVEVVDRAGELPNHWLVRTPRIAARAEDEDEPDYVMAAYARLSAGQPHLQSRSDDGRDGGDGDGGQLHLRTGRAIKYLSRQVPRQRARRAPIPQQPTGGEDSRAVATRLGFQDPLFTQQWHLVNDEQPEHSMNVVPVWDMGYTGEGVISSFVDDGLDYTSEDLKDNFDAASSYDFNDHQALPYPKLSDDTHGTRCAGQVAAGKNAVCGLGIAYKSKVAGVRILSGPISDVDEAAALNYGYHNVSIYSCSWGPTDSGAVMEGPDYLIQKAVVNGINNGRGGKGSVFVFASGNGAMSGDQCNFDGYTNSIYSVTVSAVDHKGLRPYYSEGCTANMVVAYSSGSGKTIVTTDKGENQCSSAHGGTSAAAPNAVGVFALALQARPELTWRDVQHLCVETARMINPDDEDWEVTASGRKYSSKFGYGALDGARYVKAALDWKLVKPQARMATRTVQVDGGLMSSMANYTGGKAIGAGGASSVISVDWDMLHEANFEKLEHIVVRVWIDHSRRGDVEVALTSPNGIKSVLAEKRQGDGARTGYPGWTFMTIKHWGEDMVGDWTLSVTDQRSEQHHGSLLGWNMVFWGSVVDPLKAVLYDLVDQQPLLPPIGPDAVPKASSNSGPAGATATTSVASTKSYVKPTVHLTSEEALATPTSLTATATGSSTALFTPGAVDAAEATSSAKPSASPSTSNVTKLFQAMQRKLVWAIIVLTLVCFVGGMMLWNWAVKARPTVYLALPEGNVPMQMISPLPDRRSFGSMDSDEADERTGLRTGPYRHVGFHSGFLDDDEDNGTPGYPPRDGRSSPGYRDEAAAPS